jgi:hypothetical protein
VLFLINEVSNELTQGSNGAVMAQEWGQECKRDMKDKQKIPSND